MLSRPILDLTSKLTMKRLVGDLLLVADEHRLLRSSYLDSKLAPNPAQAVNSSGSVGGFARKWNPKPGLLELEKRWAG